MEAFSRLLFVGNESGIGQRERSAGRRLRRRWPGAGQMAEAGSHGTGFVPWAFSFVVSLRQSDVIDLNWAAGSHDTVWVSRDLPSIDDNICFRRTGVGVERPTARKHVPWLPATTTRPETTPPLTRLPLLPQGGELLFPGALCRVTAARSAVTPGSPPKIRRGGAYAPGWFQESVITVGRRIAPEIGIDRVKPSGTDSRQPGEWHRKGSARIRRP
jgi:hypothetical protein